MTNTTPTPDSLAPNAYAGQDSYVPAPTATAPFDRWRWLLAGVIGILGGYLTVSVFNSGLLNALLGFGQFQPDLIAQFVLQAVFALVVTSFAYFVAPTPLAGRVIAIAIYVVVAVLLVVVLAARLSGALRLPGPASYMMLNPYFLVLLVGGLCWLIATAARPIAYLTLLLAFIVMPIGFVFALNDLPFAIGTILQLGLSLAIAIVILLASRPRTATPAAPAAVATEPAAVSPS